MRFRKSFKGVHSRGSVQSIPQGGPIQGLRSRSNLQAVPSRRSPLEVSYRGPNEVFPSVDTKLGAPPRGFATRSVLQWIPFTVCIAGCPLHVVPSRVLLQGVPNRQVPQVVFYRVSTPLFSFQGSPPACPSTESPPGAPLQGVPQQFSPRWSFPWCPSMWSAPGVSLQWVPSMVSATGGRLQWVPSRGSRPGFPCRDLIFYCCGACCVGGW